jgi:hypothetical protein
MTTGWAPSRRLKSAIVGVVLLTVALTALLLSVDEQLLSASDELTAARCATPPNSTLLVYAANEPYQDITGFLRDAQCGERADVQSVFVSDRIECLRHAHIVVFHVRDLHQAAYYPDRPDREIADMLLEAARGPGRPAWSLHQAWLAISYEAAPWSPSFLTDSAAVANLFDALVVHETGALLVQHHFPSDPVPSFAERPRDMLNLVSDCSSGPSDRRSLLPALIQQARGLGLSVDSLGKCWPTSEPGPIDFSDRTASDAFQSKEKLLRHYKFELIVANALCDFYVDEKIALALRNGAIPIHLGPPNLRLFEPDPENDAMVHMSEFNTTGALLQHILAIKRGNGTTYHAWRRLLPMRWPAMANDTRSIACRMADWRGKRAKAEPVRCAGTWHSFISLE